jgi:multiple sugar transport system substrate-binding protein
MLKHVTWGVVALWLIAATAVLPGCGRKGEEDDNTVVIWWAQWDPAEGLQEIARQFTKETGIEVKVHQISWSNFQDEVFNNFGSRRTPFDVVIGDSQWIGRGATRNLYVDLTDWLPEAVDLKTIHPQVIRYLCEYPAGSGKYYAAPCETDAVGFVYRRDWFEDPKERAAFRARYKRELAPPETWQEFREVAEFFTRQQDKRYGCTLLTGRGYDSLAMGFQMLMWSFGGSWGDEKTFQVQGHVNSEASVRALNFMKELMQYAPPGATNLDYSRSLEAFKNGSSAMTMLYFAFFPGIVKEMPGKTGFFVIPRMGDRRFASLGGQGFSISTKTPKARRERARKFIAWFLREDIQRKWITKPAGFTANTAILASDEFRDAAPYNAAFARSLDYLRDFWNVPCYNELLAAARKHVGAALDGQDAKEALDALAEEHERILRDEGLR